MSLQISLAQLREIIDAFLINSSDISLEQLTTGITTDTRLLSPGEIFLALKGERFDGHEFIETAIEKGAIAIVTERDLSVNFPKKVPQFKVKNTLEAYQKIARWWRERFDIPVIGVTGSVGKTTTKELIAAVLSTTGKVHKTQANYNNEIGVPKTLLELGAEHDYAIIEMAMRARGEIALLTQISRPTVGIITNVGTAHIGRLGSEKAIAQAKCELLAQMPHTSIAILNHDNPLLRETAAKVWQGETITYGLEGGDLTGKLIDFQTLRVEGMDFPLPLLGRHNALNYLGALAIAKVLNIDWTPLMQGLSVSLPGGRSRRYQLPNDITILDETYNAGLESMLAALHLLKETPGKRHIAVLGTMKELGERSPQFHHQVGNKVRQLGIDELFILIDDPETEAIAEGASGIPTECFTSHEELVKRLMEVVRAGDRLLFKASNSVGLNRVVEQFRTQF
ncbi:MAG: UDP-N-acetylmuramoyl-tripeptide--D-alanyl-D-alanine ligase [Hydrococcus sp. C42_A2020_068]|uniref:UDP-N-acetylmuramoyl-tripeptide--D-alanyl-D- alanine ligase n=1 Tax=Pleurocapsa sp. PCC 7327 TaxID=118163 RepID=UPI00029F8EEB|nr:UDP-N-acetylmuramoyl-tripeptide--D-alanyl-D-alanine ligase [Pleurocapsa sp. PCC 7327]AFY79328.1 UDP-N-acetylmuramoyl-tripeptide--D-alanyl-D-alanine ligase [Pleurocapsa sp. PCC 7327]MBF2022639.1 UDP-N-acetylmuramoyl-tripeptide--D-alanyl-D-alanine ligase [Hydrococcus sp. C42_A2020_068]